MECGAAIYRFTQRSVEFPKDFPEDPSWREAELGTHFLASEASTQTAPDDELGFLVRGKSPISICSTS
jgi:hypothetical protein